MSLIVDGQTYKQFQAQFLKDQDCVIKICLYQKGAKVKYFEKDASLEQAIQANLNITMLNLQRQLDETKKLLQQEKDNNSFAKKTLKQAQGKMF